MVGWGVWVCGGACRVGVGGGVWVGRWCVRDVVVMVVCGVGGSDVLWMGFCCVLFGGVMCCVGGGVVLWG